jgi:branched-chain amino acid transport system substrate-binding protein
MELQMTSEESGRLAVRKLTTMEARIIVLVAGGLSNKAIAPKVNLSPFTVNDYMKRILVKLGVKSRTAAAVMAVKAGLA